ncbi:MAG: GNAT family N-acetyltransferase [Elusimicrobiota bacterium]
MNKEVKHDSKRKVFYIEADDGKAELSYSLEDDSMDVYHTYVPPSLRGRGMGANLCRAALNLAEENNWNLTPSCVFMKKFLKKNRRSF